MDRRLIEEKLESLRRCVKRIEDKRPATAEALAGDPDLQDIVTLNLTRAFQLCVDVAAHVIAEADTPAPESMGAAFDSLAATGVLDSQLAARMKKAVGFRNIAIHRYQTMDWAIVHAICWTRLDDFRSFAAAVAKQF